MRLTKHHGLGNDFLVLLDPTAPPGRRRRRRARSATGAPGVGADGLLRATPLEAPPATPTSPWSCCNADGSPRRDERQRHPLPRPGPVLAGWADAPTLPSAPTPGCASSPATTGRPADAHAVASTWARPRSSATEPEWAGGAVLRRTRASTSATRISCSTWAGAAPAERRAGRARAASATPRTRAAPTSSSCSTGDNAGELAMGVYERGSVRPWPAAPARAPRRRPHALGLVGDVVAVAQPGGPAEVTLGADGAGRAAWPGHVTSATVELPGVGRGADRTGIPREDRPRRRQHPARDDGGRPRRRSTSWRCWSTPPAPTRSARVVQRRAGARPADLRRQGQGRGAARAGAWPPTATPSSSTTSSPRPSSSTSRSCSGARPSTAPR